MVEGKRGGDEIERDGGVLSLMQQARVFTLRFVGVWSTILRRITL